MSNRLPRTIALSTYFVMRLVSQRTSVLASRGKFQQTSEIFQRVRGGTTPPVPAEFPPKSATQLEINQKQFFPQFSNLIKFGARRALMVLDLVIPIRFPSAGAAKFPRQSRFSKSLHRSKLPRSIVFMRQFCFVPICIKHT